MQTPFFLRHMLRRSKHPPKTATSVTLPNLILAAGKLAQMLRLGYHGNHKSGMGEDFWQFRPHMPHEPASNIDWKQSARSPTPDTLWVREREKQTSQKLILWLDTSPSMQWHSTPENPSKKDEALVALLALGQAALQAGEYVGVLGGGRCYSGVQNIPRLAYELTHISTEPNFALVSPNAHIVLASDFLWTDHTLDTLFEQINHRRGITALLGILDPQEYQFSSYSGRLRFTTQEDSNSLTLPAVETLRDDYQKNMTQHITRLSLENTTSSPHKKRRSSYFMLHITNQQMWPTLIKIHRLLGGKR